MAKKSQKQLSLKEQINQSIVNAQLQQIQQNNDIAKLQAEYDAWTKQTPEIRALQSEYDNWVANKNKAQTSVKATMPKNEVEHSIKFVTAAERRAQKAKEESSRVQVDPEKTYDYRYGKTAKERMKNKVGESVQQIPGLADYFSDMSKNDKESLHIVPRKDMLDVLSTAALTPAKKEAEGVKQLSNLGDYIEQMQGNKTSEPAGLEKLMKEDPEASRYYVEYTQKNNGAIPDKIEFDKYVKQQKNLEQAKAWLDPNYKLQQDIFTSGHNLKGDELKRARALAEDGLKQFKGRKFKDLTPEEQDAYLTYSDLKDKTSNVKSFIANAGNDARKTLNALSDLYLTINQANAPTSGALNAQREAIAANKERIKKADETIDPYIQNMQTQNPVASGAGVFANKLFAYGVTSPAIESLGVAAGITNPYAKFAFNQAAQLGQDYLLDYKPTIDKYMTDGSLSDEEKKQLAIDFGIGEAANILPGIPGLVGDLKASKAAANTVDTIADAAKSMPEIDNLVNSATKQATDAANEIDRLAKQIPEIELDEMTKGADIAPYNVVPAENEIKNVLDEVKPSDAVKTGGFTPLQEEIESDLKVLAEPMNKLSASDYMDNITDANAIKKWNALNEAYSDYVNKATFGGTYDEINTARKKMESTRKAFARAMEKIDPEVSKMFNTSSYGNAVGRPAYKALGTEKTPAQIEDELRAIYEAEGRNANEIEAMVKNADIADNMAARTDIEVDAKGPRPYAKNQGVSPSIQNAAEDIAKQMDNASVPGANPLQTFADGTPKEKWATSKFRTNTAEKLGWGDSMPKENYAYRVYTEAEQNADALARYKDSQNVAKELLGKNYDEFDPADIKAAFNEMQKLENMGDASSLRMADRIGQKTAAVQKSSGQIVQASAEYTRDTFAGALTDAHKAQDDLVVNPWKSHNKKKVAKNSRIAKALADLGNKNAYKTGEALNLTHDQIKEGVIAELEKEVGSVEKYFNNNDIEFLTTLAEDESIPVWKITSEIEHKLNTGEWYTLDESIELPKPTNRKLQNALNSLVTEQIRAEKPVPTFKEITDEVRNTLSKEMADFEGQFTDDDIDYLANLIHEGISKEELSDMLNVKMATGSWGISDETLQEVNNIFKQISQYDVNSKPFVEGQEKAYKLLANELLPNATPLEKFETWRYLAMLGNPKTWIRNKVGNDTFNVVTGISNNIAALAEAGIDKGIKTLGGEGIQRTKAVLNPIADADLIKASGIDADASRYRQIVGSKYEKFNKDTLRQSKSVFNSKLAQFYEKLTDAGISDYKAVKRKYSTSLAGYLKANGYDTSIFKAEDDLRRLKEISKTQLLSDAQKAQMDSLTKEVSELNKARDYALKQAEYATFHEDNKIASVLSKWSRTSKEEGTGIGNILIEGMIPFKKTPANVLRSGIEYSPLGAIDSIKKTGKLIYENTGKRAGNLADVYKNRAGKDVARTMASDVIDSWSRTLTGTGLTALGFYLHNKGILHSSDPDTKYQDQLEGHQNYALEVNGKSYTMDWAAPSIMPLMVGAELSKLWSSTGKTDEELYNNIDAYVDAANKIFDPIIETSMLSGVRDTLETAANYAKNDEVINIMPLLAYNLATGYATQAVPTLSGQVARTVDPTRRSTYTDKEGVAGVLDRQLKKQMNKIPGLSTLNEPYVDTYGREQQNSPFNNPAANLAYQMLSPGYLSTINETDADKVSREAYEVSNNSNTLPQWKASFKVGGEKVSPKDYTAASRIYGETQKEIRDTLANDKWFNELDGPAKEDIINDINTLANHVALSSVEPEYSSTSKPYEAYKNGGIPGLLDYYKDQNVKKVAKGILEDTDIKITTNAGKEVKAAVDSGNIAKAEQIAKEEQTKLDAFEATGVKKTENSEKVYDSYGIDGLKQYKYYVDSYGTKNSYNVYSRYRRAKEQIPGLSSATFQSTYNQIDSYGDSNGSVTQKEALAYLNDGDYTDEQAKQIWEAYGNAWKSTLYKNKKGNWAAKTPK